MSRAVLLATLKALPMRPHHMNQYLIFDTLESRWLHIGYDTRASARRAALKINKASGNPTRYRVVDQQAHLGVK